MSPRKQRTLDEPSMQEDIEDGLTICSKCDKKVPDTIFCVYCRNQLHPLGWMPNKKGG